MNTRRLGAMLGPLLLFVFVLLLSGCSQPFFYPDRIVVDTPEKYGMTYESVEIRAADGTALHAWFFPTQGLPNGTVLYLHGTSQNVTAHFQRVAWLTTVGLPSLHGAQLDIDAAMRTLLARPDVHRERIFVFGQSLGGALAIYYVAHSPYRAHVRAVIADSPFADYRVIARERMAALFIPRPLDWLATFLVDDEYSPRAAVAAISPIPLLLIHGERDRVIGPHHSRLLFDMAEQPKDFWIIPGAGHIEAMRRPLMRQRLTSFLLEHCG